jgi:tetratricopeptide (TPR) repeat protein
LLQEADTLEDPAWSPRLRSRRQLALEWFHDLGGRFEAARDAGRQHVALARAAGAIGEIPALSNLADTEFELGNSAEAIALCRQAIARAAALGRPAAAAHAYGNMVPALLARGELDAADEAIRAGRALLVRGLGTAFILLMPLALLAQRRDALSLAVQLVGCADHAYASGGHVMHPPEQRMRASVLAAAGALPDDVVARLHQEGARWSEDEAFARRHADRQRGGVPGRLQAFRTTVSRKLSGKPVRNLTLCAPCAARTGQIASQLTGADETLR